MVIVRYGQYIGRQAQRPAYLLPASNLNTISLRTYVQLFQLLHSEWESNPCQARNGPVLPLNYQNHFTVYVTLLGFVNSLSTEIQVTTSSYECQIFFIPS